MAGRYRGVTRRSSGWQVSFAFKGKRYREMLNLPLTAKGEAEAYGILCAIKRDITLGVFEFQSFFPNSKKTLTNHAERSTIEHEINNWMRLCEKSLATSTRNDYQGRINKHIIPTFGHIRLGDLTRTEILEWVNNVELSPKSIRNTLCPLSAMYSAAIADGRIKHSPLQSLRLPKPNTREPEPFNEDEIERILNQLEGQVKNFYRFAFETGLRTSEQLALLWTDIDWKNKTIYISKAKVRNEIKEPKTRAGRRLLKLNDVAVLALRDQEPFSSRQQTIFLNPKTDSTWSCDKPLRIQHWYPALERAGVDKREPYQTRHTFASLKLSRENVAPIWLAAQMGHSDCSQIYRNYGRWIP